MAKGAYSFVAYPESSDIDNICSYFQSKGAEWTYILHDRDTYSEDCIDSKGVEHHKGDLKKAHWHIVCGWESGCPNWKTFRSWCNAVDAVAISFRQCYVVDCEGCTNYFTHPDSITDLDGKFHYSLSDVHSSDDWDEDAFQLADTRRTNRRKDSKRNKLIQFQEILVYIKDNHLYNWFQLVNHISENNPDYLDTVLSYDHSLRPYFDAMKDKLGEELQSLHMEVAALESRCEQLENENNSLLAQIAAGIKEPDFYDYDSFLDELY